MDTSIYNYLLTSYKPKRVTKYDSHKKQELRDVVSTIHTLTENSPVYLLRMDDDKQSYALGIKDAGTELYNIFDSLGDDTSADSVYNKKQAVSSDPELVSASISGDAGSISDISVSVDRLAKAQVNTGRSLNPDGRGLPAGIHYFRLETAKGNLDFQYNTTPDETNASVLSGLSALINKSNAGVSSDIVADNDGGIALRIASNNTGVMNGSSYAFRIYDSGSSTGDDSSLISFYELDHVREVPADASFSVNDRHYDSKNNSFTMGGALEVDLKGVTDQAVNINLRPDNSEIINTVKNIASVYNAMISATREYAQNGSTGNKLVNELAGAMRPFKSMLEANGITFDKAGYMKTDDSLIAQAAADGSIKENFGADSAFSHRMKAEAAKIKIDPMNYVNKVMVSYPNYAKHAKGLSYVSSMYSGMLFNYYC
ncbi:MAG: hypothetical protein VZR00_01760 [Lachnospiraceae bacterium]|nr:hypothetical protein [Lachnospiraceae bacterium]MEE3460601.1 hypothetical protein [Lachnospiraceae bacterium]